MLYRIDSFEELSISRKLKQVIKSRKSCGENEVIFCPTWAIFANLILSVVAAVFADQK